MSDARTSLGGIMSHELARALLGAPDRPVVVAGHGALAMVTRGASGDGVPVAVLYVAEPTPDAPDGFTLTAQEED